MSSSFVLGTGQFDYFAERSKLGAFSFSQTITLTFGPCRLGMRVRRPPRVFARGRCKEFDHGDELQIHSKAAVDEWATLEKADNFMKVARFAVALLQVLVQRTINFTNRIESPTDLYNLPRHAPVIADDSPTLRHRAAAVGHTE
jgi:hypothetical protein